MLEERLASFQTLDKASLESITGGDKRDIKAGRLAAKGVKLLMKLGTLWW